MKFVLAFAAVLAVASAGLIAPSAYYAHHDGVVAHHASPYFASPYLAAPYVAHASPVLSYAAVYPRGHGIEGQYVPDYTEKLYDDGSYKGEIY